jgi:hypothetical protein
MTTKFQVGGKYSFTFIGNSDLHVCYEVLKRTAKTVVITDGTETKRCRISVYENVEQVKPDGSYSMCPILGADDATPDRPVGVFKTGMGI